MTFLRDLEHEVSSVVKTVGVALWCCVTWFEDFEAFRIVSRPCWMQFFHAVHASISRPARPWICGKIKGWRLTVSVHRCQVQWNGWSNWSDLAWSFNYFNTSLLLQLMRVDVKRLLHTFSIFLKMGHSTRAHARWYIVQRVLCTKLDLWKVRSKQRSTDCQSCHSNVIFRLKHTRDMLEQSFWIDFWRQAKLYAHTHTHTHTWTKTTAVWATPTHHFLFAVSNWHCYIYRNKWASFLGGIPPSHLLDSLWLRPNVPFGC